ncbi:hypothetical protein GSI_01822 [Ganoderma sinense ZZ0214-1]|uniref:F-box domain-containing protein n=1 Tax=Ganoderma sinense ZZ0214-1 TaxID=1077348 RepID=A0A2G8SQY4_9APHY|nr:hypothetical protein GSI_01822 [Ganoderma sinense ZZ0214-1]
MNDLPGELHDSILDFLIGDPMALKACCTTCKLWLPRAQRNLHLRVVINQKNINLIHATLCGQPYLATVIRELTLNSIDGNASLRRIYAYWLSDGCDSWISTCPIPGLRACHAEEPTTFLTVIGALPHLLHLDIEHCWSKSFSPSPIPDINAPKLRSLSLVNYASLNTATATVFEACLEYPAAFSKLRILDIRLPAGYADPFDRFLQTVGPSLRELTIGVRPEAVLMRPLTLANCCGLRLLNFELKLKRPTGDEDHLRWLAPVLDSVRAPKLRRVKFVVRAQNVTLKDFEAFDWDNVSRTLADVRFTSVCEVLFYVTHCDLPENMVASFIHKRMGALYRHGLRVTQRT